MKRRNELTCEVVKGVEGWCIVLGNRRICGPKPWGGGRILARWFVDVEEIERAISEFTEPTRDSGGKM